MEHGPIRLSSKVFSYLSTSIYRTPAMAVRELVANAWDGDATRVEITTNRPLFHSLVVTDNGTGLTRATFHALVAEAGIGKSSKVPESVTPIGRPVLGRLGIGILALAQVCYELTIESHHAESQTAFRGTIKFENNPSQSGDDLQAGVYTHASIPYSADRAGTRVVTSDLRDGYDWFMKTHNDEVDVKPARIRTLAIALPYISRLGSVSMLGGYWTFAWELAVACPLQYMPDYEGLDKSVRPFLPEPNTGAKPFHVFLDGFELFRPVQIPSVKHGAPAVDVKSVNEDVIVHGKRLAFHGYVAAQHGQAISPAEMRGVVIRMNGATIGMYDRSFFGWSVAQGPRLGWITAEVDVVAGLTQAMNIDRASFNESDEQFVYLKETFLYALDNLMKDNVRPQLERRSEVAAAKRDEHLWTLLAAEGVLFDDADDAPFIAWRSGHPTLGRSRLPKVPAKRRALVSALIALAQLRGQNLSRAEADTFAALVLKLL